MKIAVDHALSRVSPQRKGEIKGSPHPTSVDVEQIQKANQGHKTLVPHSTNVGRLS